MNTRGGTIGTATPRPTRHTRALPTMADHRQWKGAIRTEGPSRYQRGAAADMRRHTAAHTRREYHTGHLPVGRRHGIPWIASSRRRPRRWTSNQRLQDRPQTATTTGKPTLPGRTPSHNPTMRDRATRSANRTTRIRDTRVVEPRLPAPEDGRPGEGQRLAPDAPHNGGGPPPPGGGPPLPPRHAAPTGHASQGDSAGPPHPHTRAHSTWRADPDSPPGGRALGGGGAPDLRCPSRRQKARTPVS